MRLVSEVEKSWIEDYLVLIRDLDLFKLAGMHIDTAKIEEERKDELQRNVLKEKQIRDEKLIEAKARYAQRKKVKLN